MRHGIGKVRGVGMIEVLVAVAVLAFGMLGIAAMQAVALRNSQSALERSQVVMHTYAILDAMRANRDAAMIGEYDMGAFDADGVVTSWICNPPDTGSLAANDRRAWIQDLHAALGPSSCAAIECDDDSCAVAVQWNDARGSEGESDQSVYTNSRL